MMNTNLKSQVGCRSATRSAVISQTLTAAVAALLLSGPGATCFAQGQAPDDSRPQIQILNPPESGFYAKELSFHGVLIKAPQVVEDQALYEAYNRMAMETAHLPMVVSNLAAAGAEVHIIGRNQVTTDLPEWQHDKHVPLDEYNGLTRDQRTRGMGGLITSCGEENLLKLPTDRYRGRDILVHEFAHNIEGSGIPRSVRALFDEQYQKSKEKGLWLNSYAGSNPNEYFAELTMWYFGTHGDLTMTGPKPDNGPEGLKKYDPDAYALFDKFYSGQIEIAKVEPRLRRRPSSTNSFASWRPRDSQPAREVVAKLDSFKVGETRLSDFFADAGMTGPTDHGTNGWYVIQREENSVETNGAVAATGELKFRVEFHDPRPTGSRRGGRGGAGRVPSLADLDFKDGVLTAFKWNN